MTIGSSQQTSTIAALLEERIGLLNAGNSGPIAVARRDNHRVALFQDVNPVIHATNHDRAVRTHPLNAQTFGLAALQALLDGLTDCKRLGHTEADRRIDRHAAIGGFLDSLYTGFRSRDLDLH